jgi:hypothetical protein
MKYKILNVTSPHIEVLQLFSVCYTLVGNLASHLACLIGENNKELLLLLWKPCRQLLFALGSVTTTRLRIAVLEHQIEVPSSRLQCLGFNFINFLHSAFAPTVLHQ